MSNHNIRVSRGGPKKTPGTPLGKANVQVVSTPKQKNVNEFLDGGTVLSFSQHGGETGKPYPGRINFTTMRILAGASAVVRAILTLRSHQVAKLSYSIVPKNVNEPPQQIDILEYSVYNIEHHPAFDDAEIRFLRNIFQKLDPKGYIADKKSLLEEVELTDLEESTLEFLQNKHEEFYNKRKKDIREAKRLLDSPDPWFSDTRTWESLLKKILNDILILDRGAIVKLRDEWGKLIGLMPVDGATIRPNIDEYGFMDPEQAYVQVVFGNPIAYLRKEDVVILMSYPVTDVNYFGYGFSPIETLYSILVSDLHVDKGNFDYYRKGGSIPEGFISIEPPPSREGMVTQIDQEQLEAIQRNLSSIMMGDYTQVPIVSGGKVSWVDFKGKRRDMQFKELADYLARKICAVLQVSPQDIGLTQDVNRSTASTQAEMTKSKGLETLMKVISEYLTAEVLTEFRPEGDLMLSFEEDDVQKTKELWQISQQQLMTGVVTINQVRAGRGEHPVPWGNTPLQGLRNWKPEEDGPAGGPGMPPPGLPGLPPMPGVGGPPGAPPVPTPDNPGGMFGGSNPGAGQPEQMTGANPPMGMPSNMKSTKFFELSKVQELPEEDEAYTEMIKSFSDMYVDNSNYHELLQIYNIADYTGGADYRTPEESFEYVSRTFGVNLYNHLPEDHPVMFAKHDGGGNVIMDETGNEPVTKSIARAIIETRDLEPVVEVLGGDDFLLEAVELAVWKSLDQSVGSQMYEDLYRFRINNVSDAQVEEVLECLKSLN